MTAIPAIGLSAPPLVMGGAGFSYQLHPDPESLPITEILIRAFELGIRSIDTSPYYEPSEQLMGAALAHADIKAKYGRGDYEIMTKVGRINENEFDYSPDWVYKSVARSLERFQTPYLDVVFCHDVEFVPKQDVITAVGVLLDLQRTGHIRCIGISGYDIDVLVEIAATVLERLRSAGVNHVFCSSPLAVGLLRKGGIPTGLTGDWHPAPEGLRASAAEAATWVENNGNGETFSSVALQYAIMKAKQNCKASFAVSTITGVSSISDLEQNVAAAKEVLKHGSSAESKAPNSLRDYTELDQQTLESNAPLFEQARLILGEWVDYDFSSQKSVPVKSQQRKARGRSN
ncbi:unnamed protein product [Colletotrichum noveboracense]|uniref:NADP-dependent oxidoreductase domain-containing protein n=1 Tax=Colletotrichum noveboracense TaxID=2664923 RepID=A0A9W4S6C3_9PEZI|nr:unnamed protein product [Colletotrichum noveboracense]